MDLNIYSTVPLVSTAVSYLTKKKKTGAERLMAVGVHLLKGNVGFAEVKECTLQLNVNREIE